MRPVAAVRVRGRVRDRVPAQDSGACSSRASEYLLASLPTANLVRVRVRVRVGVKARGGARARVEVRVRPRARVRPWP